MAMGIVTDKEFEKELNNSGSRTKIVELPRPGRNVGDNNVPDSLRKIIGETSEIESPSDAIALANEFGISRSSVSAYSNGSRSTNSMDKRPGLDHINSAKERITRKARKILIKSINNITDEKLADAKPEILAGVARSMSGIIKEMEPEVEREKENDKGPTFIIYSPHITKESHFDVVNARE